MESESDGGVGPAVAGSGLGTGCAGSAAGSAGQAETPGRVGWRAVGVGVRIEVEEEEGGMVSEYGQGSTCSICWSLVGHAPESPPTDHLRDPVDVFL